MGRSTIALLLILAGLLVSYQFYLKDNSVSVTNNPQSTYAPNENVDLFRAEADKVKKVSWRFSDSQYGELSRENSESWSFVNPTTVIADNDKAQDYVSQVLGMTGSVRIPLNDSFKLSDAGLESAQGRVSVTNSEGVVSVLRFGDSTTDDSQVYVHLEGSDFVSLVYQYQVSELKKVPTELELSASPTPGV